MMSPNDKIEELIPAVGSVAEMCKVCYDACIDQGFTGAQAMLLTSQIPRALFTPKSEEDVQ